MVDGHVKCGGCAVAAVFCCNTGGFLLLYRKIRNLRAKPTATKRLENVAVLRTCGRAGTDSLFFANG